MLDLPPAAQHSRYAVRVASSLRRARRAVGVDSTAFATLLTDRLLGDLVGIGALSPERLAAWEAGEEPAPAVVLLAAAELADLEVEVLLGRLPMLERIERLERQLNNQRRQLRVLSERPG